MDRQYFLLTFFVFITAHFGFAQVNENLIDGEAYLPNGIDDTDQYEETVYFQQIFSPAFQYVVKIDVSAHEITTRDGAIWALMEGYEYIAIKWNKEDQIIIKPASFWGYSGSCSTRGTNTNVFRMVNTANSTSILVKLISTPDYNGEYTYWIHAVSKEDSVVILNNGTKWKVNKEDLPLYESWSKHDNIIVGFYQPPYCCPSIYGSIETYILINASAPNYVRADKF